VNILSYSSAFEKRLGYGFREKSFDPVPMQTKKGKDDVGEPESDQRPAWMAPAEHHYHARFRERALRQDCYYSP
jgi:hypothetical protein